MSILKKMSLYMIGLLLVFTGIFFIGCGEKDYSKIELTCSDTVIDMDIGETKIVTFTIDNYFSGMDGTIDLHLSKSIVSLNQSDPRKGVTTVEISALNGGTTILHAVTREANKECFLTINVREYSSTISPGKQKLYVSNSEPYIPSSSHFVLDDDITEAKIDFYFYGTIGEGIAGKDLTLDDIKQDGAFINQFDSVRLEDSYLIFSYKDNEYTLKNLIPTAGQNQRYDFIPLVKNEEGYDFSDAFSVSMGSKFTFVGYYSDELIAQRDFFVMPDIDKDSISFTYTYPNGSTTVESKNSDEIILVPNRDEQSLGLEKIDYSHANLNVTVPNTDQLIKVGYQSLDTSVAKIDKIVSEDENIFDVSCKSTIENQTSIVIKVFYDGYESDIDSSVCRIITIPVKVKFQPKNLTLGGSETYTFYNHYLGDYGWQDFYPVINPTTSSYTGLNIIYNPLQVRIRYNGQIYTDEDSEAYQGGLRKIYIASLNSSPISIKGADDSVGEGKVSFELLYDIFGNGNEEKISTEIKYQIVNGATLLDFNTDEQTKRKYEQEGIYFAINSEEAVQELNLLYADKNFANVEARFKEGDDVAEITFDNSANKEENGKYILKLKVRLKSVGSGVYTIRLDNGRAKDIKINVIEVLNNVSIDYGDNNIAIHYLEVGEDNASLYLINSWENSILVPGRANFILFANGSRLSLAIDPRNPINDDNTNGYTYTIETIESQNSGKYFNIALTGNGNGNGYIDFKVHGYKIENFSRLDNDISFRVNITSYSLIEKLNIYKEKDGDGDYQNLDSLPIANYIYVYKNTNNSVPRTAQLTALTRRNGYLFYKYQNDDEGSYQHTQFENEYIYWTVSDARIFGQTGIEYQRMLYGSVYQIGTSITNIFGTFDTKTMTFVANATAGNDFVVPLIAHVRQFDRVFSFKVEVRTRDYNEIKEINVLPSQINDKIIDNSLNFSSSSNKRVKELIIYASPEDATNTSIVVTFTPNSITEALLFGAYNETTKQYEGITLEKKGSAWLLRLEISQSFIDSPLSKSFNNLTGKIEIAAQDWVEANGEIREESKILAKTYTINFQNGTQENPYYLESAQDVLDIKLALNAHYKLSTEINISSISNQLPLGEFSGSLIGTNQYAKLSGIAINNGTNNNYGIFTINNGEIENIRFEGKIQVSKISSSQTTNLGLVCGVNEGVLKNIGVTILESTNLTLSGAANIGFVTGKNNGQIIQDFQNTVVNGVDYGTLILLYMDKTVGLRITADLTKTIYAGGITGYNAGLIEKIDNETRQLYGYASYLAYANITIDRANFIKSSSILNCVGVVAGYSERGDDSKPYGIYGKDYGEEYQLGEGVLVGGHIEGPQYVGGAVGYYKSDLGNYKSDDETILEFNGITSRVFVVGQSNNSRISTIGAITGNLAIEKIVDGVVRPLFNNEISPNFAIQAVDDGALGVEASMVIRYLSDISDKIDTTLDLNIIAFGSTTSDSAPNFMNNTNVVQYLSDRKLNEKASEHLPVENESRDSYYGNFVEVSMANGEEYIETQVVFEKDDDTWSIQANEGFKPFYNDESKSEILNNIFYAYYFKVASLPFSDREQDINLAQSDIDRALNIQSPESSLYPILASNHLILKSRNSDILSISQSGEITTKRTGIVRVDISSILNENNSKVIYFKVINYINTNNENADNYSIVFPDVANNAYRIDDSSSYTIKGSDTVRFYVRPNYSLNSVSNAFVDQFGKLSFGSWTVQMDSNSEITAKVEITSKPNSVQGEVQDLNISVDGQVITISRKNSNGVGISTEGEYTINIEPYFTFVNASPSEGEVATAYCYINYNIKGAKVIYSKGAESISVENLDVLNLISSKTDEIIVNINSSCAEEKPYYAIYRMNEKGELSTFIQSNYDLINTQEGGVKPELELFSLQFSPERSSQNGLQQFKIKIAVDKNKPAYLNRYSDDIYCYYKVFIYANSNTDKYTSIILHLENTNISSMTYKNYEDLNALEEAEDFSISSEQAYPGTTGLLMVNITPDDADFDYITIVNSELANVSGNGSATFRLFAKYSTKQDDKLFYRDYIVGEPINNGLRISQGDLINFYNKVDENRRYIYDPYTGIIYIGYDISSNGIVNGSISQFIITAYKNDRPIYDPITITLTNNLRYHAYVTIDGKTSITSPEREYYVARGLRYRLNLDYYGFSFDNITVQVEDAYKDKAEIIREGNQYYLQISSDAFNYSSSSNGFEIDIIVNASQVVDGEPREDKTITTLRVLEYVIDYNFTDGISTMPDIIFGSNQGVINVQVGNSLDLAVDILDFVEYDSSNQAVVNEISTLMNALTNNGTFVVYTNLNDSGISKGGSVNPQQYETRFNINTNTSEENIYFKVDGLSISPKVTHDYMNSYYMFTYDAYFKHTENTGIYSFVSSTDSSQVSTAQRFYTEFRLNVYQSSSNESPIPVDNFYDLMNMYAGSYYILMNDITLDNDEFTPITSQIASFDGNGYTIRMNGVYELDNSQIGLFESVAMGAVIKNLTIELSGDTLFRTSASSFQFGLIAGQNNGNITNCYVTSQTSNSGSKYAVSVECTDQDSGSYAAGITGQNSGNVTNCRSSVNIKSGYNTAGLVGENSGKIASSYFKDGILTCTSQYSHKLGGLVVDNTENGQIITSYVSGDTTDDLIFSTDKSHYLLSSKAQGGFAYSNSGTISDCYSNIRMFGTSEMSGFVHVNIGLIRNSFSLSIPVDNLYSSAGFTMTGIEDEVVGRFENCYYLSHISSGEGDRIGNVNASLANIVFEGLKKLDIDDFANLTEYFSEYAYSTSATNNSVWFYSNGRVDLFNNEVFNSNRLELVAPNIIAFSQRYIMNVTENEETGETIYQYGNTSNSERLGSIKNPYLISNADEMENYIIDQASRSGFNFENYRLISDIDYLTYPKLSSLYEVSLAGSLEGNGMAINGIDLISQQSIQNGGLFAQIGRDALNIGSVMNLTLNPLEVKFTNASCVGGLAGTLSFGYIYNVTISTEDELVITGKNFVGGLIGRALNTYAIKNVVSNISVASSFKPSYTAEVGDDVNSYESSTKTETYSYAGSLIGFAGGKGIAERLTVNEANNIMGDRIGVGIGGIGKDAKVNYLKINLLPTMIMRAYRYGGFAVGEIKGTLSHVSVIGDDSSANIFALKPEVARAVGGIAGLLSGGTLDNAYISQDFMTDIKQSDSQQFNISTVGGIVGRATGRSTISKSIIESDIQAISGQLGGAVGLAEGALTLSEVAVKSSQLNIRGELNAPCVGGLIGYIGIVAGNENRLVEIYNSYSNANLNIEAYVYGRSISANVGSFVGYGTPLKMSYCYATGSIKVKLEDFRQTEKETVKQSLKNLPTDSIIYNKKTKTDDDDSNYDHVYFYGWTSSSVETFNDGMFEFYARPYNSTIVLTENTLGNGSYDYAGELSEENRNLEKDILYYPFNSGLFNLNEKESQEGSYVKSGLNESIFYKFQDDRFYPVTGNDRNYYYAINNGSYKKFNIGGQSPVENTPSYDLSDFVHTSNWIDNIPLWTSDDIPVLAFEEKIWRG